MKYLPSKSNNFLGKDLYLSSVYHIRLSLRLTYTLTCHISKKVEIIRKIILRFLPEKPSGLPQHLCRLQAVVVKIDKFLTIFRTIDH